MTVVLEDQVKTIAAEVKEDFGGLLTDLEIDDIVRMVIAQYDISSIARLDVGVDIQDVIARLEPPSAP